MIVIYLSPITREIYFGELGSRLTLNVSTTFGRRSSSSVVKGEPLIFDWSTNLTTTSKSPYSEPAIVPAARTFAIPTLTS